MQAGAVGTGTPHGASYSWQFEYRQPLAERFAWSAAWINEGHPASHHRDGLATQVWATLWTEPEEFSLALGAGGYWYADTQLQPGDGYKNVHGATPIFSVAATYYTPTPWFVRLAGNHIDYHHGLGSHTVTIGAGYRVGRKFQPESGQVVRDRAANALLFMGGRTIVNSRSSEHASATAVEYRRAIGRHSDWTLAYLDEGDPLTIQRKGFATQWWLVNASVRRRYSLGLGVGPYYYFQCEGPAVENDENQDNWAVVVSPSFAFRVSERWLTRVTWNRVVSRNDRDADVIVMGLGYFWGTR